MNFLVLMVAALASVDYTIEKGKRKRKERKSIDIQIRILRAATRK